MVAIASCLLIFAGIALFASVYSSADRKTPVLLVTRTVEVGHRFTGADLGQADVGAPGGVALIPASEAASLVGKRATVTVLAGSLLTAQDAGNSQGVTDGEAVVGVALKEGQLPAAGLETGDQVMIVETTAPGSSPAAPTSNAYGAGALGEGSSGVLVPQANVFDVEAPSANDSTGSTELVSVEVSSTLAAAVSVAAAADQLSLVLLPQGNATGVTVAPGVEAP